MSMIRISHRLLSVGRTTFKPCPYYNQSKFSIDKNRLVLLSSLHVRSFHSSSILFDDKSKIEKTVDLLKDKVEVEKVKPILVVPIDTTTTDSTVAKRKTLWQRIVHEIKHYYNGFKLLFIETKIAFRLLRQVLNGHTLTRRERKQVTKKKTILKEFLFYSLILVYTYIS